MLYQMCFSGISHISRRCILPNALDKGGLSHPIFRFHKWSPFIIIGLRTLAPWNLVAGDMYSSYHFPDCFARSRYLLNHEL